MWLSPRRRVYPDPHTRQLAVFELSTLRGGQLDGQGGEVTENGDSSSTEILFPALPGVRATRDGPVLTLRFDAEIRASALTTALATLVVADDHLTGPVTLSFKPLARRRQ